MKIRLAIGLLLIAATLSGFRYAWKYTLYAKPDFSGNWNINLDKSENGEGAPITIHVTQTGDSLIIERVTKDGQSFFERLSFDGKPCVCLTTSKRRKTGVAKWDSGDKPLTETGTLSDAQDLNKTAFNFVEHWELSTDGKELTLKSTVTISNGQSFTIKAVFDKG
ncbi:MAG TPA: hypothetical protein VKR32_07765 [Puia sp.]|nr:hypothetical protein [Puia sp.]